jgi:inosine-uridine nucleoside N-ribohydrolase
MSLSNVEISKKLYPETKQVQAVLDSDTFNEVDDQFALAYAAASKERIDLKAVYAAPFLNALVNTEGEGMIASFNEIKKILKIIKREDIPVFKGSDHYLSDKQQPIKSPAALDLIQRALSMPDGESLHVISIGAPTNLASALLIEPKIADKIVITWLGGQPLSWPQTWEFNLMQDMIASKMLFETPVPLTLIPCMSVASGLITSSLELDHYIKGKSKIGTYLTNVVENFKGNAEDFKSYNAIVKKYMDGTNDFDANQFENSYDPDRYAWSKVIWDISTVASLVNPSWANSKLTSAPTLTDDFTWDLSIKKHPIRVVSYLNRDAIFGDLFYKINSFE